jgi:hypothetical protein
MRTTRLIATFLVAGSLFAGPAGFAGDAHAVATIVVQNNDGAGEGFNDPTAFVPEGGNNAATLGQARLAAFQYAADIWADCIDSDVAIIVSAQMNPLTCTPTGAVLGSAGASTVVRDFANAPVAATWYCVALANALAGVDLVPGTSDITAQFNSNLNGAAGCLGGTGWYYGFDGNAGSDIDFVSVVLHELGHGLGFQMFANVSTGAKLNGFNDTYMLNMEQAGGPTTYVLMSNAQRVTANTSDPNLRWIGASVTGQVPLIPVTGGLSGGRARLHAPAAIAPGSSVSHWSTALFPNELMEPNYTAPNHDVSLALNLMEDIGWTIKCDPQPTTVADTDTLTVSQTATTMELQVEVTNTGAFTAFNVTSTMTGGPAWLSITDPNCDYPDLAGSASSFGLDTFLLDISGWPGGSFTVDLEVTWLDVCGSLYSQTVQVDLLPATLPTPVASGPRANRLEANVPNPFNPATTIRYQIAEAGRVTLRVYDVSGRLVRTLADRSQVAGPHEARWNGTDDAGRPVASGVYFYRLQSGDFSQTRRMVLLK